MTSMISLTGKWIPGEELGTNYWYQNMREPVLFEQAVLTSLEQGPCSFVEIGSHPALQQHIKNISPSSLVLGTLSKKFDSMESLSKLSFSIMTQKVCRINLKKMAGEPQDWSSLRAFDRQKYWIEPDKYHLEQNNVHPAIQKGESGQPGYGADINFKIQIDPRKWFFVKDHKVQDEIVIPGALSLEMAIAAAKLIDNKASVHLENVDFEKLIFLKDEEKCLNMNLNYSAFTGQYAISDVDEKSVYMRGRIAKDSETKKLNIGSIESLKKDSRSIKVQIKFMTCWDSRACPTVRPLS